MDNSSSRYSHVVWDWNGTLLDDLPVCIQVINEVLQSRNLKTLAGVEEYQSVFCFPISKYYEKLGFDFALESFDSLAAAYMHNYDRESTRCQLFSQAHDVLGTIRERELTQVVLSASERSRLHEQLVQRDALQYFETYLGLDDYYANTKVDIGHQWVQSQNGNLKKALMVGDTLHDFDVATKLGFDCVLVSTGHQSKEDLEQLGCPVLTDISEVLAYL